MTKGPSQDSGTPAHPFSFPGAAAAGLLSPGHKARRRLALLAVAKAATDAAVVRRAGCERQWLGCGVLMSFWVSHGHSGFISSVRPYSPDEDHRGFVLSSARLFARVNRIAEDPGVVSGDKEAAERAVSYHRRPESCFLPRQTLETILATVDLPPFVPKQKVGRVQNTAEPVCVSSSTLTTLSLAEENCDG